jgi:hypothetical protein
MVMACTGWTAEQVQEQIELPVLPAIPHKDLNGFILGDGIVIQFLDTEGY